MAFFVCNPTRTFVWLVMESLACTSEAFGSMAVKVFNSFVVY